MCRYLIAEKTSPFQLSLSFNPMYLKADTHQQAQPAVAKQHRNHSHSPGSGSFEVTGLDESLS